MEQYSLLNMSQKCITLFRTQYTLVEQRLKAKTPPSRAADVKAYICLLIIQNIIIVPGVTSSIHWTRSTVMYVDFN